ncbi:ABC transporter permease subunit [Paenibacillus sp. GCM10027626]|uniref:ABC transporter permease subunit n=1 Tax=Paenibacillus sp. GCM10027626 TaxID=3273411 RepID=UPI0036321D95
MSAGRVGKKRSFTLFLAALPFVIFVLMFSYVPLFGWIYSFFNYKPALRLDQMNFVGFDNFAKLYSDRHTVLQVMKNTLAMSFLNLLTAPLPMIGAILLNEIKNGKFRKFIQTATTLPNFISWIVVFSLSYAMFSTSGGFVYTIMKQLGLEIPVIGLMGNADWAWIFQLLLGIWKTLGWSMIIYIAAIAGIDGELYEAARIDGANRFRLAVHITLPNLAPTFFVLLLLQISNLLNNGFDQYFVFYNSLVSEKLNVLDYYVYSAAFRTNDYSYATVLGMLKSIISLILLFSVNRLSKKLRGQSLV